ncbi:MAG: hypothetical protein JWR60_1634 [Polaromonas sp.]|nr:hypothetical protein [Polaromonas sp.]
MTDPTDTKKSKDRSPSFPFIDLQAAIERVRQMQQEEGRSTVPLSRLVMHWRYSEKSSGALQTVGALKSYGLLEEVGVSSGGRLFKLSDLALRILLDQREDESEKEQYVLKAALNPPVAKDIYSKWSEKLPQDSTINHYLVFEKKFTQSNALTVTKILKQNHTFAKVSVLDGLSLSSKIETEDNDIRAEDMIDTMTPVMRRDYGSALEPRQNAPVQRHYALGTPEPEVVYLPDGKVFTMQFSSVPDLAAYKMLKSFVEFKIALFSATQATSGDNSANEKINAEPGS